MTVCVSFDEIFPFRINSKEDFIIEGNFIMPTLGSTFEPPESGYFEDATVFFRDEDFTNIADNLYVDSRRTLYEAILDVADEKAMRQI